MISTETKTRITHKRVGRNKQTLAEPELRSLFGKTRHLDCVARLEAFAQLAANDFRVLVPAYVNNPG